jgi:hypothetical protein
MWLGCGCVVVWLRGCVVAWLRGCVVAWLRGCGKDDTDLANPYFLEADFPLGLGTWLLQQASATTELCTATTLSTCPPVQQSTHSPELINLTAWHYHVAAITAVSLAVVLSLFPSTFSGPETLSISAQLSLQSLARRKHSTPSYTFYTRDIERGDDLEG